MNSLNAMTKMKTHHPKKCRYQKKNSYSGSFLGTAYVFRGAARLSNMPDMNLAVSADVKNCPFFLRTALGKPARKSLVRSIICSSIKSSLIVVLHFLNHVMMLFLLQNSSPISKTSFSSPSLWYFAASGVKRALRNVQHQAWN